LERWNSNPDRKFQALIIQPYVLVQEGYLWGVGFCSSTQHLKDKSSS
jgi:hypothetical protein